MPSTEAAGGGPQPRQADAAGRARKKALKPIHRRPLVQRLIDRYRVSQRRACRVLRASRSSHRYQSQRDRQEPLRMRLKDLAAARVHFGSRRLHELLRREGWRINHKRVYRLYREEGLALRRKTPRRHVSATRRVSRVEATEANHIWAMDFMADQLFGGQRFRLFTLVDHFSRESLAIEVGQSLTGGDVVRVLDQVA